MAKPYYRLRASGILLLSALLWAAGCGDKKPATAPSAAQTQMAIASMDRLIDAGKFENALKVARELSAKAPDDPLASEALARALLSRCNSAPSPKLRNEVADAYAKAAAQRPTSPGLQSAAGVAAYSAGRIEEAIRFHQRARQLEPGNPQHLYLEAMMWNVSNQPSTAVGLLEMALKLQPDSPDLEMGMAEALAQSGEVDPALEHMRRARSLAPNDAANRLRAASLLRGAGHPVEAAEMLLGGVSIGSADRATSELCAHSLADAGKHAESAEVWERIATASLMEPEPLLEAAREWSRAGHQENALIFLEKARQANAPTAYYDLIRDEIKAPQPKP